MNVAIITSSKDIASLNIRNSLIELFDFETIKNRRFFGHRKSAGFSSETNEKFDSNDVHQYTKIKNKPIKLYQTNQDLIFAENIDRKISADILIFASKHRSKENTPSFTVHPIGNFGNADFGGKEKALCFSSAFLLKNLFIELNNVAKNTNYELTMEATHHGPYVEKPAIFIEIGSTEKEWNDSENGKIIAKTIMNGLKLMKIKNFRGTRNAEHFFVNENHNYKIAVGVGGPHYCNNFNRIMLRTDIAVSHICPKHHLEKLDENLIKQAIGKTIEKTDFILLDWKGLGKEKQRILNLLKNLNIEIKRTGQVLN